MTSTSKNKASGFTLMEVMIAMGILVFISLGIYQAITETYHLRDVLLNEGDFYSGIRLAMDIVDRDVSLMYSPALMLPPGAQASPTPANPAAQTQSQQQLNQALAQGDLGQTYQFWGPAIHITGIRSMHFIGTDSKMSFVSASHMRIYKDARESDFAKISYSLDKDKFADSGAGLSMLIKTESSAAFLSDDKDNKDTTKHTYPLLHGIKKFKIRYYKLSQDQWTNAWDSEKEDQKGLYPDIIELTLEVSGPQRLAFEGKYLFKPEIPLRDLNPSS